MSDNFYEGDEVPNMANNPYLMAKVSSQAIIDIAAERRRQVEVEGWTPQHDDGHDDGKLATAAGWYALNANSHAFTDVVDVADERSVANRIFAEPDGFYRWPWNMRWWKPKDRRRDLVRAGALIVAEIERLDRANSQPQT